MDFRGRTWDSQDFGRSRNKRPLRWPQEAQWTERSVLSLRFLVWEMGEMGAKWLFSEDSGKNNVC